MNKVSSAMGKMECQSEKMTKTGFEKDRLKAEAKGPAKAEDFTESTPALSGAVQPEAKSFFQNSEVATSAHCFVRETCFN